MRQSGVGAGGITITAAPLGRQSPACGTRHHRNHDSAGATPTNLRRSLSFHRPRSHHATASLGGGVGRCRRRRCQRHLADAPGLPAGRHRRHPGHNLQYHMRGPMPRSAGGRRPAIHQPHPVCRPVQRRQRPCHHLAGGECDGRRAAHAGRERELHAVCAQRRCGDGDGTDAVGGAARPGVLLAAGAVVAIGCGRQHLHHCQHTHRHHRLPAVPMARFPCGHLTPLPHRVRHQGHAGCGQLCEDEPDALACGG